MRHVAASLFLLFAGFSQMQPIMANEPDSAYLFSYATTKNSGHNGLHFAYSLDQKDWKTIGPEFSFLKCDYGRWGAEKRMLTPFLTYGVDGLWHCIWSLNEKDAAFAHAASADLVRWKRQSYPTVASGNCLNLAVHYIKPSYILTWESRVDQKYYRCETKDFKTYTAAQVVEASKRDVQTVSLPTGKAIGQIHRVAWPQIAQLKQAVEKQRYWESLNSERITDDAVRFAHLEPQEAQLTINAAEAKPISDVLTGIFFEDINYAADGGLYAELIQNRDFEYTLSDKEGRDKNWNSLHSWSLSEGTDMGFHIDSTAPIHPNNPHYAVLEVLKQGGTGALINVGYDGIALKKGEKYNFSIFAKQLENKNGKLAIRLQGKNGETYAQTTIGGLSSGWQKRNALLTASADASDAHLEIVPLAVGKYALDMVSLFPQNTFLGHPNGLRKDLVQTLADIHPRFVRFPGGCVSHGDGLDNIYRWKNTIGPLEARKPQRNLWNYHQTAGLGYFEYFQFCEDIGAQPLPVMAAGVPCQNSATGGGGQQGGIPLCEMDQYIQDILDLIEWANGDAKTTQWGKVRAQAGHPKPFNLKYVGIGNEDLITDIFEERFSMIFKKIKEMHPEITVIGTVGPSFEGTDYEEGWDIASRLAVPMVDEHYYQSPGWFINHQDYYDLYDRSKPKVYLGEYAAHVPGRANNLETALAEALYMTTLERNGDVVSMASYAPLLAREGHTQWTPDLIYFNNTEVKPTTGYQVQKLFGQNAGDRYLSNSLQLNLRDENVQKRVAVSVVRDSKTGDLVVKLVNLLPVSVKTNVKLDHAGTLESSAQRVVLTGKPDGLNLKPTSDVIPVGTDFPCELPRYSFTVIRIKQKNIATNGKMKNSL
jgi:alpha-L-arabinofuranosidase